MTAISTPYIIAGVEPYEKLRAIRKAAGITQAEIARRLGIDPAAVSQWESGKTRPDGARLPLLATILGQSMSFFVEPAEPHPQPEVTGPIVAPYPPEATMPRNVPIRGAAAAGDEADGIFNVSADIIDYGRRPPSLSAARDVYGLYVASDSMDPAHRRGDLIYVRTQLPPRPGDDVIIQIAPASPGDQPGCFLKRLVRRTADRIIVQQFNPPREFSFPVAAVMAIHRVLTATEILGT